MKVLAIDPGPVVSALVVYEPTTMRVISARTVRNEDARTLILSEWYDEIAIEMIAHMGSGMPAGSETFETVLWIGRFDEAARHRGKAARLVKRHEVKTAICGTQRAKDPNIRQALIDRFGGDSVALAGKRCQRCKDGLTKTKVPKPCERCTNGWAVPKGPLYDLVEHEWSALAVAVTFSETRR